MKMESETELTLDSLKFRIKTEEEFIEEYGENWRKQVPAWVNGMERYLFGKDIPISENLKALQQFMGLNADLRVLGWCLTKKMFKYIHHESGNKI